MELYEREYFISRIVSGYFRHKVDEDLILKVYSPNVDQNYEAQEVFSNAMHEAKKNEILTKDEMLDWMIHYDVWNDEKELLLKNLPKELESFKEQLYINRHKFSHTEQIRKYIAKAKKEYVKISNKRHEYDVSTREGYATFCRWNWIIEQCTFFDNGKPYDWKQLNTYDVLTLYKNDVIDEKEYRELAREEPWRSYWGVEKTIRGVFGVPSVEATIEQKTIALISRMYDNVQESMECPSDDVIEDDDMLDGWFINQRKQRDAEKKTSQGDSVGHAGAQDVYLMADGKEDVERIQDMNDMHAQIVSKQRHDIVEQKGKVSHEDLPDVRRDIQMQANQMQAAKKG